MSAILKQALEVVVGLTDKTGSGFETIGRKAETAFGSRGSGLAALGNGIKLSMAAAAAGVAAVGAGFATSTSIAADFQQEMANVKAVTGATGESFQALTNQAKTLGETTQFSATESAQAMQFLGMAGLDTKQILGAMPGTLNLAAAGMLDLGEAADISTNIMSSMGLEVGDLNHVVDGLAVVAASANTNVREIGQAMTFVGGTAKNAGLSFDETSAALGLLANNGLKATRGGTSLNAALRELLNPSKEAATLAKDLGLAFTDQEGRLLPLVEIVGQLEDANLSAQQGFTLFGDEGSRAINALVSEGSTKLSKLETSIRTTENAARDMADIRMGTLQGAFKELGSAAEAVGIAIGEDFLPITEDLVRDGITPALRATKDWITEMGGIPQMISDVDAIITAFAGAAWEHIDNLFSDPSYREKAVENFGNIFSAGLTLAGNFLLNAGKVILTGATAVFAPLEQAGIAIWEVISFHATTGINAVGEIVVGGINQAIEGINLAVGAIGLEFDKIDFTPLAVDAPRSIETHWGDMKDKVVARVGEVGEKWGELVEDVKTDSDNVKQNVTKAWDESAFGANTKIQEIVAKYAGGMEDVGNKSTEGGKTAGENFAGAAGESSEKNLGKNKSKFVPKEEELKAEAEKVFNSAFKNVFEDLFRGDLKGAVTGFASDVLAGISSTIAGHFADKITDAIFSSEGDGDNGFFGLGKLFAGGDGKGFLGGLGDSIGGWFGGSDGFVGQMADAIGKAGPQAALAFVGLKVLGPPLVEGIGKAIEGIGDVIGTSAGGGAGEFFTQGTVQFQPKQMHEGVAIGLAEEGFNAGEYVTATTVKSVADALGVDFKTAIGSANFLSAGDGGFNRAYNDDPQNPRSRAEALAYLGLSPDGSTYTRNTGGAVGGSTVSTETPTEAAGNYAYADDYSDMTKQAPGSASMDIDLIVRNVGQMMAGVGAQLSRHIQNLDDDEKPTFEKLQHISDWLAEGGDAFGHIVERYHYNNFDYGKTQEEVKNFVASYLRIPRFLYGGVMRETGPAYLHQNEGVLTGRGMRALDMLNSGNLEGFAGGGGPENHFHIYIQALDGESIEHLVEGKLGDLLYDRMFRDSEARRQFLFSEAVVEAPTV